MSIWETKIARILLAFLLTCLHRLIIAKKTAEVPLKLL